MLSFLQPVWPTAVIAAIIVVVKIASEIPSVYLLSPAVTAVAKGFSKSSATGFYAWVFGTDQVAIVVRRILLWMGLSQLVFGVMVYLRSVWDCKLSMRV